MQVTASKVEDLLHCTRPFDPDVDVEHEEPNEAMRYGSAVHEGLYYRITANFWNPDVSAAKFELSDAQTLAEHVESAYEFLRRWLQGANPYKKAFSVRGAEQPLACKVRFANRKISVKSRSCGFEAATHTYDLRPGEFGCTYDLLVHAEDIKLVIDYKTGEWGDYVFPARNKQLLALALATEATHVAILHTPQNLPPVMHIDEVSADDLDKFALSLWKAMRRIGDGSLRPGSWCKGCAAQDGCPARDGALLRKAGSIVKAASGALEKGLTPGATYQVFRQVEKLGKRFLELTREDVLAGEVYETPDGGHLATRHVAREIISKASIERALGAKEAAILIAKLRSDGCIHITEYDQLVVKYD